METTSLNTFDQFFVARTHSGGLQRGQNRPNLSKNEHFFRMFSENELSRLPNGAKILPRVMKGTLYDPVEQFEVS